MITFEYPFMLLLLILLIPAGLYLFKKTNRKVLVYSRLLIFALLIIALANPFSYVETTESNKNPDIALIVDTTDSMNLFNMSGTNELMKKLSKDTNARMITLSGKETRIGDSIIGAADGKNQILLISDGNDNYGETLERAVEVSKEIGSVVSVAIPDLISNDMSVEIKGEKTVITGNEISYNVLVRAAVGSKENSFVYRIYADGKLIKSGTQRFNDLDTEFRESEISFTHKFETLGTHTLRAEISSSQDKNPQNNVYTKTVYVIEKPEVIIVTENKNAPLAQIAGNLYNVTVVSKISEIKNLNDTLSRKKTVILDNMYIGNITENETKALKKYVSDGGGLVTVGGMSSYDRPSGKTYLNSSFEKMLPVISVPSDWKGDRDVILLIDVSLSSESYADDSRSLLIENIKKTATNIVNNKYFNDSNIALAIFGNVGEAVKDDFYYMGNPSEKRELVDEIRRLNPSSTSIAVSTDLESGLLKSSSIIENRVGEPLLIVLTDGNIIQEKGQYEKISSALTKLDKKDVSVLFISINSKFSRRADQFADPKTKQSYGKLLMDSYKNGVYITSSNGGVLNPDFETIIGPIEKKEDEDDEKKDSYNLKILNSKHFITSDLNISDTKIYGFNDVTQKGGAERLVITETGNPVVTVWRYGLGRVASITTDNGDGTEAGGWASQLYTNPGSKLISAAINWAIADPEPKTGVVIECPDAFVGTPVKMKLTNYEKEIPIVTVDGKKAELIMIEKDKYESEITFNRTGQFNISGYPVYVNYPIEYRDVGINKELKKTIEKSGGQIYSVADAQSKYIENIKETTTTKTKTLFNYSVILCLTALVIFITEIAYRRIVEIKKLKKQEQIQKQNER